MKQAQVQAELQKELDAARAQAQTPHVHGMWTPKTLRDFELYDLCLLNGWVGQQMDSLISEEREGRCLNCYSRTGYTVTHDPSCTDNDRCAQVHDLFEAMLRIQARSALRIDELETKAGRSRTKRNGLRHFPR